MANKYGGYGLRVVGTDQTKRNINLPQAQLDSTGGDRSQGYMNQAASSLGSAAQSLAQGTQQASQISANITENAMASNNAQVAVAKTQAQTAGIQAQNSAQVYGTLSKTLLDYHEQQTKEKARKQEAEYRRIQEAKADEERARKMALEMKQEERAEYNFQTGKLDRESKKFLEERERFRREFETDVALPEYAELERNAIDIIYNQGGEALKSQLNSLAEKYRGKVTPEFIVEWNKRINGRQGEENTRQASLKYKRVEQVQDSTREQHKQVMGLTIASYASQIASGVTPVAEGFQAIDAATNEYIERNKLSVLDGLEVRNFALKEALASGKLGLDARNAVTAKLQGIDKATSMINQLFEEEKLTSLPQGERNRRLLQISAATGVDLGEVTKIADPLADIKSDYEASKYAEDYIELERNNIVRQVNLQEFDEAIVGSAVGKLILQGDAAAQAALDPNNPTTKGIRFYEHARQVYKQYTDHKKLQEDSKQGIAQLQVTQAKLRVEYEKLKAGGNDDATILKLMEPLIKQSLSTVPPEMQPSMQSAGAQVLDPAKIDEMYTNINNAYQQQIYLLQEKVAQSRGELARYGLDDLYPPKGQVSSLTKLQLKNKARIEGYDKAMENLPAAQQQGRGAAGNFRRGAGERLQPVPSRNGLTSTIDGVNHQPIVAARSLKKVTYQGKQIASPFGANTSVTVSDDYGADPSSPVHKRRGRPHAGIDFAVPNGTHIVSPVAGKVVGMSNQVNPNGRGYGQYLDVQIPDGRILRYAHLSGASVSVGQTVQPGQVIARSGDSGSPGAHHLHFEVRTSRDGYAKGSTDPKAFLAEVASGYIHRAPRRNSDVGQSYYNPYKSHPPDDSRARFNFMAVRLPNGKFIENGQVQDGRGYSQPAEQVYNRSNPIKDAAIPSTTHGLNIAKINQRGNSYSYAKLAKDPKFADAITEAATWLGVPGVWLADVFHFESQLNPQLVNRQGFVGLAQFGKEFLGDIGLTTEQVRRMNYTQQIEVFKKYVNYWGLRGQITNMGELYTMFQRPALVKKLKKGDMSPLEMRDGNGGSVREYIEKNIGSSVGRKYRIGGNRDRRSSLNIVHDKYAKGCALCDQMASSNSPILPHRA